MKMKKLVCLFIAVLIMFSCFVTTYANTVVPSAIAAGFDHTVALNRYGRVYSFGGNTDGQCRTYAWKDVISVCAGKNFSAALFSDGTVKTTDSGFSTGSWENIVKIVSGDRFLAALKSDGTVLTAGEFNYNVSSWQNIKDIAASKAHLVALKDNGTCVGTGGLNTANVSDWTSISKIFGGSNLFVCRESNICSLEF